MLDNEETVLHIPSEDAATHKMAACLGAELQAGHKMYTDLQALYIPSNASISERPQCTTAHLVKYTSDRRESDYESIEREDTPPYLNVNHSSITRPAEGESQRYRNTECRQDRVDEAIYDRVQLSRMTPEEEEASNSDEYYNIVTVAMTEEMPPYILRHLHSPAEEEEESSRTDPSPPPLGPKPVPRRSDQKSTIPLHELVDGDYYEVGVSIFTSNNDQVVV